MSQRLEAATKVLRGYTGDCTCHEGYASRNLIDPDCCYHEVPPDEAAKDVLDAADKVMFSAERMALVTIELANEWTGSEAVRARMIANIFKGKTNE